MCNYRLALIILLSLSGCGESPSAPDAFRAFDAAASEDAPPAPPDTGIDAATPPDAAVPMDAAPESNACKLADGLCVSDSTSCIGGGGSVLRAGASGCIFDDGPGVCCAPPAASATGDGCAQQGGLCAPIAGCNFVDGAFAQSTPGCENVGFVCCVPETVCGVEDVVCCGPGPAADFRPFCDRGTYSCVEFPGTELRPTADCPL